MTAEVLINGVSYRVALEREGAAYRCRVETAGTAARDFQVDAVMAERDVLSLVIAGRSYEIKREGAGATFDVVLGGWRAAVEVRDPRSLRSRRAQTGDAGPKKVLAPMPGKVIRILAAEKAQVEAGQGILVIEAMKMQNELKSPRKGTVRRVLAAEGSTVNAGDTLAIVE